MKTVTLATVVADDDAIKTAFVLGTDDSIKATIASSAAPALYALLDLDGAIGTTTMDPPRAITVTVASNAGSYTAGSTITFVGLDADGEVLSDSVTIVGTDGDENLETSEDFASVSSIAIQAQADVDGSFTFGVSPHDFSGHLDGVIGDDRMSPPRTLTVKTTAIMGAYNVGSTIVATGLDASGRSVTETFTINAANGGETIAGDVGFSQVLDVEIEDQTLSTAEFKIGVRDYLFSDPPIGLRFGAVGNIRLGYNDPDAADVIATLIVGEHLPLRPKRIYCTTETTTSKVTLVF